LRVEAEGRTSDLITKKALILPKREHREGATSSSSGKGSDTLFSEGVNLEAETSERGRLN